MAGIDFDRQAFVPAAERAPRPTSRLLAPFILVIAVAALGLIGFKLLSEYSRSGVSVDSQGLEQIQQQLAGLQKRIDQLEKRRKVSSSDLANVSSKPESHDSTGTPPSKRSAYRISSAIPLQAEAMAHLPTDPVVHASTFRPGSSSAEDSAAANHEAWQATTDRLADVVGVVGSQQGELSQAREDLNRLLVQTRRSALQFELHRGRSREPVGPVSLSLKASDPKTQRYTVCVYLENQCVELKDRVINEVVVFVLHRNSAPLELVATKILRDQIVGYLEIPVDNIGP